jgi:P4 family phage/plasmid primase-like protien
MDASDPTLAGWLLRGGNYGVIGGDGLVIIDVDGEDAKSCAAKLPMTFAVESPGSHGLHLYYLCVIDKPIRLRDKEGENIGDIQGRGKQVVGPGCVHPNGGIYTVVRDMEIARIEREDIVEVFKDFIIPEKEIDEIEDEARSEREKSDLDIDILKIIDVSEFKRSGEEYFGPHPSHGSRNGRNLWVNPGKGVWHCFRHETGGGPLQLLAVQEGVLRCEEATRGALRGDAFKATLEKARERGLIKEEPPPQAATNKQEKIQTINENKRQGQRIQIAKGLLRREDFVSFSDTKEVFRFDKELWFHAEPMIAKYVREQINPDPNEADIREIKAHIRDMSYVEREIFEPKDPCLIPLNNGIFDIKNGTVRDYPAEDHFFTKLPIDYNPESKCPAITKFLEAIVGLKDIRTLVEFAGFALYREYFINKALMLLGEGANGKSTFIELVRRFLGKDNCSSVSLHQLNEDRFSRAYLYHKLGNFYADLSDKGLKSVEAFLTTTGRDTVTAAEKYKGPFDFMPYAKHIFSANKLPRSSVDTNAFFRRWMIVEFPHKFEANADRKILEKITTPEELSGFLNLALEALKRLLTEGRFTNDDATENIRKDYLRRSDSILAFAEDRLEVEAEHEIMKSILYREYTEYTRAKLKMMPLAQKDFTSEIKRIRPVDEARHRVGQDKKEVDYYIGVKLKGDLGL